VDRALNVGGAALDEEFDALRGKTAHLIDDQGEQFIRGGAAVNLENEVAGLKTGPLGGTLPDDAVNFWKVIGLIENENHSDSASEVIFGKFDGIVHGGFESCLERRGSGLMTRAEQRYEEKQKANQSKERNQEPAIHSRFLADF